MVITWQPTLEGALLRLRPMAENDFEGLFAVASDPLIWEQHPEKDRCTRAKFQAYFASGMESGGALVAIDRRTGDVIGSSRFTAYDPQASTIEIGYTFLARRCWGGAYNREMKALMLDYAFGRVEKVHFRVGPANMRSRRALEKIGARETSPSTCERLDGVGVKAVLYELGKLRQH